MNKIHASLWSLHLEAPSKRMPKVAKVAEGTIIVSDIVGANKLFATLPAKDYFETLDKHVDLVSSQVSAHGGEILYTDGDSIYVSQPGGIDTALALSTSLQQAAIGHSFGFSVGISHGDIVERRHEATTTFEGTTLVMAKAMAHIGNAGAIFLCAAAFSKISSSPQFVSLQHSFAVPLTITSLPYFNRNGVAHEYVWSGKPFGQK
ncbi:hypothetical protein [Burkholderia pyrrocinia]|uniref:hypothetical protein n=1 Tax=Burkholderia pyrrocinia TaxID=60550 RepID=UPI002AB21C63|nr:hypothetical protein [Burkholderia pyrrocinia]